MGATRSPIPHSVRKLRRRKPLGCKHRQPGAYGRFSHRARTGAPTTEELRRFNQRGRMGAPTAEEHTRSGRQGAYTFRPPKSMCALPRMRKKGARSLGRPEKIRFGNRAMQNASAARIARETIRHRYRDACEFCLSWRTTPPATRPLREPRAPPLPSAASRACPAPGEQSRGWPHTAPP